MNARQPPGLPKRTTGTAKAALVLGVLCVVIPAAAYVFEIFPCFWMTALMICAIAGGMISVMAYSHSGQSKTGKRMAMAGMGLCLLPMVLTLVLFFRLPKF
jgi:hypothetical protein